MTREVAMEYWHTDNLACPICAKEGKWTHLHNLGYRKREDRHSPDGVSYEPIIIERLGDRRLYPDDIEERVTLRDTNGTGSVVTKWKHHYTLQCPIHPVAFNRHAATKHVFTEDELPKRYWQMADDELPVDYGQEAPHGDV